MIDFDKIPSEQIIARGQYSMVRAERENWLKNLRGWCEEHNAAVTAVLRDIQNAESTERHFAFLHANLASMAEAVAEVEELTRQLELIRPLAFPA